MRQLIARIDDELHARLKDRAAIEHRSVNSLVTELLESGVSKDDVRSRFRARLRAEGRLYVPPKPKRRPPSRDAAIEAMRGLGPAVIEALEAGREPR